MKYLFQIGLILCCFSFYLISSVKVEEKGRDKKFLSMFQVVRFPNDACDSGDTSKNGTCYTKEECSERGGTESGTCASGFGVCCITTIHCGDKTSENTTYFESRDVTSGDCNAQVCKSDENICQIRLDFVTFKITGPETATTTIGKQVNGIISADGSGKIVTAATQCNTDSFSVASPGNPSPPVICGTNTDQHMYVDASEECVTLNFKLADSSTARSWTIKITQFKCDYENLAPHGCTQYFFNPDTTEGSVETYNYDGGKGTHLAQQRQTICVRREKDKKSITWSADASTDFKISGNSPASYGSTDSECCGYGPKGTKETKGYDCAMVPGGVTTGANGMNWEEFCGFQLTKKVTSTVFPFKLVFNSDNMEHENELLGTGFKLKYTLA